MNIEKEIEKKAKELIQFRRRYSIVLTILDEKEISVKRACEVSGVPGFSYYEWNKRDEFYRVEGCAMKNKEENFS